LESRRCGSGAGNAARDGRADARFRRSTDGRAGRPCLDAGRVGLFPRPRRSPARVHRHASRQAPPGPRRRVTAHLAPRGMNVVRAIRVLAISGSLRSTSSTTALVHAAARLAPPEIDVSVYEGLGRLPAFNPDVDVEATPNAVAEFRAAVHAAEA